MGDFKIGQTVRTGDGRQGIIRFLGTGTFAPGDWAGLELPDSSGKNDGSVKGERYFDCAPDHGIFVRPEAIVDIVKQPPQAARSVGSVKPANGTATKPRPSSGVSAEAMRKRQSFMSSGLTPGSRLSIRSPTRSPTKGVVSSASSNASTPRTGTPATTARTSDSSTKSRLSTSARPSMGPPATSRAASQTPRASIGGGLNKATSTGRAQPRMSTIGTRTSIQSTVSSRSAPKKPDRNFPKTDDGSLSPPIGGKDKQAPAVNINGRTGETHGTEDEGLRHSHADEHVFSPTQSVASRKTSILRPMAAGSLESRAASQREIEQYKARICTLERQLIEQRDQVISADSLQADKQKLETVIQALQNKLRTTLQAKSELQVSLDDAEARAAQADSRGGEHESELEMATLDKEMAEERAESAQVELEFLKTKHEELELEVEILREENKELGSVMTPEEKASAGWLQRERERDRLRDALVLLRDISQQKESELKGQIKELQQDLSEAEEKAMKLQETSEKLSKSEAANKHLMEQLEAIDSNEDLNLALEAEREQKQTEIEKLREQLLTLQEEAQVSNELETYYVSNERELQQEIDAQYAMLNEKEHSIIEQNKIIEDLEYTLSKFRDVVSGLQGDIDDLRRSKGISEIEAHEMSSKSRAMMDLNLQLQNSAAKMQLKTIDIELGRMHAEESAEHLAILKMFVPDSYESEKTPVLTSLCLRRIRSKALLVTSLLRDRIKDRPHLNEDDPFILFEAVEGLTWLASCCDRFLHYVSACTPSDLEKFRNVLHELEPVERSVNTWVEALKRDELSNDGPKTLLRMRGVMLDLVEKCLPENAETMASQLLSNTVMVESYCDSAVSELQTVLQMVQSKLGRPTEEDEESMHFDKKMDQFTTKTRTIKYVAGKTVQRMDELRLTSMCVGESAWSLFPDAEESAQALSQMLRQIGSDLLRALSDEETTAPWTYTRIADAIQASLSNAPQLQHGRESAPDEAFNTITTQLQSLQSKVDELLSKALDVGSATEFEKQPSPWLVRSKEIRAEKIISQDVQDQLRKLKSQAQAQTVALNEKEKQLEERQIKIDFLESRTKDTKQSSESLQRLVDEAGLLRMAKEHAEAELRQRIEELQTLTQRREADQAELEALKKAQPTGGSTSLLGRLGPRDETAMLQLRSQVQFLNAEVLSLQAAVRYLKMENYRAKIPLARADASAQAYAWLDASALSRPKPHEATQRLKAESDDIFSGLLELAKRTKPLVLKPGGSEANTTWRARQDTPRYVALRQREELEQWNEWRDDLLKRARLVGRQSRRKGRPLDALPFNLSDPAGARRDTGGGKMHGVGLVEIVGSPPR